MKVVLGHEMAALLNEVIASQRVPGITRGSQSDSWDFDDEDRTRLIDAILAELVATGLKPDSEPNQRGLRLEDLLDHLNRPWLTE